MKSILPTTTKLRKPREPIDFGSFCSQSIQSRLTVFLPPLPEVGCPIFLEIENPLGKVMERSGLRFEHFCLEVV